MLAFKTWTCALALGVATLLPARSSSPELAALDERIEAAYARVVDEALARVHDEIVKSASAYEDHSTWDNPWVVTSKHYEVRTTWGRKYAVDLAKGLDTMFGYFVEFAQPARKVEGIAKLFVLPDQPSYNQFGDEHGGHASSMLGGFFAAGHPEKPVVSCWHPSDTLVRMWATHGAWHEFAQRAFPGVEHSTVLEKGLAAYFSAFWDWKWMTRQFLEMVDKDRFVPLATLLRAKVDENTNEYGERAGDYFTQLAVLFRFLRYDYPPTRDEGGAPGSFVQFIRTSLRGQDPSRLPVYKLIFERTAEVEKAFRAHIDTLRAQVKK